MSAQSSQLVFESALFEVQPGEDAATNPGIFGRSLAHWLGQRLVSPDFSVDDVIAEDFGWCVASAGENERVSGMLERGRRRHAWSR